MRTSQNREMPLAPAKGLTPPLERQLNPGIASEDLSRLLNRQRAQSPDQIGVCSQCGYEGPVWSMDAAQRIDLQESLAIPAISGDYLSCAICEIGRSATMRYISVFRGFVWYLFGTEKSPSQEVINRSIWRAALVGEPRFRETHRAQLRDDLALDRIGRGFKLSEEVLTPSERAAAEGYIFSLIPRNRGLTPLHRGALLGSLGVHHLLQETEQGRLSPRWIDHLRYFPTPSGLLHFSLQKRVTAP